MCVWLSVCAPWLGMNILSQARHHFKYIFVNSHGGIHVVSRMAMVILAYAYLRGWLWNLRRRLTNLMLVSVALERGERTYKQTTSLEAS